MPLVVENIEIHMRGMNKKHQRHYISLGYKIPNKLCIDTTMSVLSLHLTNGSGVMVNVVCPICNKIRKTTYKNFNKSSDICLPCTARMRGKMNRGKNNGMFGKRGKETPSYKNGKTQVIEKIRKSNDYLAWRNLVWERDSFKCRKCNKRGGILNCHHVESFTKVLEYNNITNENWRNHYDVIFDINNGITLCNPCHIKLHEDNGGFRVKIGVQELNNFLNIDSIYEYQG